MTGYGPHGKLIPMTTTNEPTVLDQHPEPGPLRPTMDLSGSGSDPIRSGRIRVRSAAADRYRFYVRSVLVAAAAICVAAGAIVVDRASHPIRRAVFQCWHEANPTQPDNTETMCAWIEYRSEPTNAPTIMARIRSDRNA